MADQAGAAPWTIKSVPVETRQKAVKAAHAQDQTMAQWLVDAVNRLADRQAENQVIPPGKPAQNQQANLPDIDLAGLAAAISATGQALAATGQALAAAGTTPSKSLGREAAATLRHYIRAVRGLPSRQTKAKNRQTLQIEDLK